MPDLSRPQIIAWSLAGLIVLLIGANYLRGQIGQSPSEKTAPPVTVGIKTDHASRIKVHVIGAVVHPGLYELDSGARVNDSLQMAGGALPSADLNQINLAAKLADGQQVAVPEKGAALYSGGLTEGLSSPSASAASGQGTPLNLNSATLDQLQNLDGVGPKTAQKIIEYRESHGGFKSTEELMEVPGIGPAKYDQINNQVTV